MFWGVNSMKSNSQPGDQNPPGQIPNSPGQQPPSTSTFQIILYLDFIFPNYRPPFPGIIAGKNWN
jgi:hypothetical protein